MSLDKVGEFVFQDNLSHLNLKPYWERYRRYFFGINVASIVGMVYILLNGVALDCLPHSNSTEILDGFSDSVESFVESSCLSHASYSTTTSAIVILYYCGVILYYSKRLHDREIVESFERYVLIRLEIEELHLTPEQLKSLSTSMCHDEKNKAKILKIRKACNLLWNFNMTLSVRERYRLRNVWLLIVLIVAAAFALWLTIYSFHNQAIFCTITRESSPAIMCLEYDCVWTTPNMMPLLWLGLTGGIIGQIYWVCIAIVKSRKTEVKPSKAYIVRTRKKIFDFLYFGNTLWRHSGGGRSTSFDEFCDFMATDAAERIKNQFLENFDSLDVYLIGVFSKLSRDWKTIAQMIYHQISKNDFKCESEEYKALGEIVTKMSKLKWCENVKDLLDFVYDKKYFELFVRLLNIETSSKHEGPIEAYLSNLRPDTNVIGQPYKKGRSLLYHALRRNDDGTNNETAANRIMCSAKMSGAYFVHYDGLSVQPKKFVKSQGVDLKISKHCDKFASKQDIENILQDIRLKSRDGMNSLSDIAKYILHLKFMPWTKEMNHFAETISKRREWEVLVALMNAFIVVENLEEDVITNRVIPGCNLDLSEAVNPTREAEDSELSNSLLYFAFTKRDYAPFTLTAAATILHLTRGRERKVSGVSKSRFFYTDPVTFIDEISNVTQHHKIKLKALVISNDSNTAQGESTDSVDGGSSRMSSFRNPALEMPITAV